MPQESGNEKPVTEARISRCRDSTPLGVGIALTGPDLLRLGIDPIKTDVVEVYVKDGSLQLVPCEVNP